MKRLLVLLSTALIGFANARAAEVPDNLVLVEGGTFKNTKSNYHGKSVSVPSFYLGKHEVTQKEWNEVMGSNPSQFQGDNLPVEMVSWYDCVEYCNKRSIKEGLKPYYTIDQNNKDPSNQTTIDTIKWTVTTNAGANGYRLPTEAEWEYAAGGGQKSLNYSYAGGNEVDQVAWYWRNAGDENLTIGMWYWPAIEKNNTRTHPVGGKQPNELGLYDMSGNVREWCWEWYGDLDGNGTAPKASSSESGRVWRGGGWMGGDFCCESSYRGNHKASGKGPDQGLRVCRGK